MPHESIGARFEHRRRARGESLEALSARSGVRRTVLEAIEDNRLGDLPHGIYARAAIRATSTALGFPPDEILAACEPLLPEVEDQVAALARLRGGHPPRPPGPSAWSLPVGDPGWRLGAAATIDGLVVAPLLIAIVAVTTTLPGTARPHLSPVAAPAFAVIALMLGACYFILFGGIAGTTAGAHAAGLARDAAREPAGADDLRAVFRRAGRCACRDLSFLMRLGTRAGSRIASSPARGADAEADATSA